jgi:peptidoglycan/LPS O-acetylase OafA/YrhL
MSGRKVLELDGLRAVAITLVFAYHVWSYAGSSRLGGVISFFAWTGWSGVDVFFAISGYLITGILLGTRGSPTYWRDFYVRRALRIFPVYYAVLTLLVLAGWMVARFDLPLHDDALRAVPRAGYNYLYVSNFAMAVHGHNWVPLDIAWSLAVEEQFYLVFPFVVRWGSRRALIATLVAATVAAPALRLAATHVHAYDAAYVLPFCRMDSLAVGALAALLVRHGSALAQARVGRSAPFLWTATLVLFRAFWKNADHALFVTLGYGIVAMSTAATIVRIVSGGATWLSPILRNPALVGVGRISYGLYLIHQFVHKGFDQLPVGRRLLAACGSLTLAIVRLGVIFAFAASAAAVSWIFFEEPILRWKERLAPTLRAHHPGVRLE